MVKRNSKSKDGSNRNVDGKILTQDEKLAVIRERRVQKEASRMNLQELEASEVSIDGRNFPPGIRVIETAMVGFYYPWILSKVIGDETMSVKARTMMVRLLGLVYKQSNKEELMALFSDLNQQSFWVITQELVAHKYVRLVQKRNNVHHTLWVCDEPKYFADDLDKACIEPACHVYEQDGLY